MKNGDGRVCDSFSNSQEGGSEIRRKLYDSFCFSFASVCFLGTSREIENADQSCTRAMDGN